MYVSKERLSAGTTFDGAMNAKVERSRRGADRSILCRATWKIDPRIASLKMLPDNFPVGLGRSRRISSVARMAGKISMRAKLEITSAVIEGYRAVGRLEKGRILDELCAVAGWHRKHAIRALSS
jgi:hypothetical protein